MSLEVKPVHLKYVFSLMRTPEKYPDFFHADAEIFRNLFMRIDEKTTHYERKKTKNPNIAPSSFGEMLIEYSESTSVSKKQESEVEEGASEKYHQDTFLNLAAWYILPLIEANKRKCPYMPRGWVTNFLQNIANMEDVKVYLQGVLDFMREVDSESWMKAFADVGSQLGTRSQGALLILVGMFLDAYEEQKRNEPKPSENTASNVPRDLKPLLPSVIEFMESIEDIDKLVD